MRGALLLLPLLLLGCIDKRSVIRTVPGDGADPVALARRARDAFEESPRAEANVQRAHELVAHAARVVSRDDPARIEYLVDASRYAIWLARHGENVDSTELARSAITHANTVIQDAPGRVEGPYYRAIAIGLFAKDRTLAGRTAQIDIRDDAMRAIELDETFDHAGPHRVLGALYLRAPGPPTGVGSFRRAIRSLEKAMELAPEFPPNALFLAEAFVEWGRELDRARELLDAVEARIPDFGEEIERTVWRGRLEALRAELAGS